MAAVAPIDNPSMTTTTTNNNAPSSSRHHGATVRLSDRIAELGLCRRDEAERILGGDTLSSPSTHDDDDAPRRTTTTTTTRRYRNDDAKKESAMTTRKKVVYVRGDPIVDGVDARVPPDETDIEIHGGMPVRLSKRMSELGMCSRREAAAMLSDAHKYGSGNDDGGAISISISSSLRHLKGVVYLRGRPVLGGAATKVPPGEECVEIRPGNDPPPPSPGGEEGSSSDRRRRTGRIFVPYHNRPWSEIMGDTIVLNKPVGYVSGQEEHRHVPAVRLLNRGNMHLSKDDSFDPDERRAFGKDGDALHFDKWKYGGYDVKSNSIPRRIRETLDENALRETNDGRDVDETLSGYAPAGRLDIDSTGVILFTRAGIVARRLIEPESKISKEYVVRVQPAVQLSAREVDIGLRNLPRPTRDLAVLLKHGNRLAGENGTLKPLLAAQWLSDDRIRLVLVEGKKRQIRRMCRELIGWHVVELVRTSVGPVKIDSLPEGKWRPLTREEVRSIFDDEHDFSSDRSAAPSSDDEISRRGVVAPPFEEASSPSDDDVGRGGIAATLSKRGISEKKVMRVALDALRKEAGPDGWFPLVKLQAWVGRRLMFLPKEEGKRKQWKEHLLQICRDYPTHFVVRGTQHVGLRGEVVDTKRVVESDL